MISEYTSVQDLLDKLKVQLDANVVAVAISSDIYFATDTIDLKKFWSDYKHLKQPLVQDNMLLVPILKKNSLRILLYLEKESPKTDDAMFVLTWMINNISEIEYALNNTRTNIQPEDLTKDIKILAKPCSPGIAMGKIVVLQSFKNQVFSDEKVGDIEAEISRLVEAVKLVCSEMQAIGGLLVSKIKEAPVSLFNAYCSMLDRHGIVQEATEIIVANQCSAEFAVQEVIKSYISKFNQMPDPYLRARTIDLKDIGNRIVHALSSAQEEQAAYPSRTILVADELSPITVSEVPIDKLVGLICKKGSKYSHAGILARALGVPFVIDAVNLNMQDIDGKTTIVDGYTGSIHINPPEVVRRNLKDSLVYEDLLEKTFQDVRDKASETGDGASLELNVNVGLGSDIRGALRTSADGVGLFRTELPFMLQNHLPMFNTQLEMYTQMLKTFHPKKVVIRTLDAGGDKSLPYLYRQESNPYLGSRGIRFSLEFPSVFRMQLKAIMLANAELGNARILLPMVSALEEVIAAYEIIQELASELSLQKVPELGVMIEVPGIVSELEVMTDYVDFFSVGTNDLTQYLLAVDRNNNTVANLYNSWHPAVISSLYEILMLCKSHKRPVSVCGELAGDPMGALLLISMGYRSLSMSHKSLLRVKWLLRQFTTEELSSLWWEVFDSLSQNNANKIVARHLSERELGRFISKN